MRRQYSWAFYMQLTEYSAGYYGSTAYGVAARLLSDDIALVKLGVLCV